eukprot:CAMPEP_0203819004 /NCGR_PEP_ID=MMETSP0115-20131106/33633_1 /ASSEMBLY_ACC=CAM_ASM_000227 /TAXON_ID=33651 /ORGANISM="Bicosoecid sp, Strain ms1" /LENGTH=752 /DNA_ID=CAMNT_0050727979 /DNA_START=126 /DNA_END=2381 /DNA_ORIENTATION=+
MSFRILPSFKAPLFEDYDDPVFLTENHIVLSVGKAGDTTFDGIAAADSATREDAAPATTPRRSVIGPLKGELYALLEKHSRDDDAVELRAAADAVYDREGKGAEDATTDAEAAVSVTALTAKGMKADWRKVASEAGKDSRVRRWLGGSFRDAGFEMPKDYREAITAAADASQALDTAMEEGATEEAQQPFRLKLDYAAHMLAAYRAFDSWHISHNGDDALFPLRNCAAAYCSEMVMETYFVATLQDPALRTLRADGSEFQITRDSYYNISQTKPFPLTFESGSDEALLTREFRPDACVYQVRGECLLLRMVTENKARYAGDNKKTLSAGTEHDVNKCAVIVIGTDDVFQQCMARDGRDSSAPTRRRSSRLAKGRDDGGGGGGAAAGGGGVEGGAAAGGAGGASESKSEQPRLIEIPSTTFDKFGFRVFAVFVSETDGGVKERRVVCVHRVRLPNRGASAAELRRFVQQVTTIAWSIRLWIEETKDSFYEELTAEDLHWLLEVLDDANLRAQSSKAREKAHRAAKKAASTAAGVPPSIDEEGAASDSERAEGGAASAAGDSKAAESPDRASEAGESPPHGSDSSTTADSEEDDPRALARTAARRMVAADMRALSAAGMHEVRTLFVRSEKYCTPSSGSEASEERVVRIYACKRHGDSAACVAKIEPGAQGLHELEMLTAIRHDKVPHVVQLLDSYSVLNGSATALLFARASSTLAAEIDYGDDVSVDEATTWARQLLRAVAALHDAGIIHCDI